MYEWFAASMRRLESIINVKAALGTANRRLGGATGQFGDDKMSRPYEESNHISSLFHPVN
jgi:hypothetical protein